MPKNINTSTTLKNPSKKSDAQIQKELRDLNAAFRDAGKIEMVEVMIPNGYSGVFTNPHRFSVNGVVVSVPIGEKALIPKPHADHLRRMMNGAILNKEQKILTPEEFLNS